MESGKFRHHKKGRKRRQRLDEGRHKYGKYDTDGCLIPSENMPIATFSKLGEAYFKYTKEQTPEIGKAMKNACPSSSSKNKDIHLQYLKEEFDYIYSVILPLASKLQINKTDFSMDMNLLKDKEEGSIIIFSQWHDPKRVMGILYRPTSEKDKAKDIPDEYQYNIQKIILEPANRINKEEHLDVKKAKKLNIVTTRKGVYVIYVPSLAWNLKADMQDDKGNFALSSELQAKLIPIYKRYIQHMTKKPAASVKRSKEDKYIEQFIMDKYPNANWREAGESENDDDEANDDDESLSDTEDGTSDDENMDNKSEISIIEELYRCCDNDED